MGNTLIFVLMSPRQLSRYWSLAPSRILHVGAHRAEESPAYRRAGWGIDCTVWVEADEQSASATRSVVSEIPDNHVVQALAWDVSGHTVTFNVTSNGESSSGLDLQDHAQIYPHITVVERRQVTSTALADHEVVTALAPFDLINLDIQGAELLALKGLGPMVESASGIYSGVNRRELYSGCAHINELDAFLEPLGFIRVDTQWTHDGWGDALWLKSEVAPRMLTLHRGLRLADQQAKRLSSRVASRLRRVSPRF